MAPDGTETPEVVMLPDGRLFRIERVESRRRVGDGYAFSVLIGSHVTTLWKELCGWSGPRWSWCCATSGACRARSAPGRTTPRLEGGISQGGA